MMPWRTYLARVGVAGIVLTAAVFVGVRLATADPGGPTSPNELTYSGVLRNRAGTGPLVGDVTLMFTLRRTDGSSCPPVTVSTIANANGAFSAPVSTRLCPSGFFNGDQISYDVSVVLPSTEVGPLTPDGGVAITPVPYARFADQAGVNNDCPAEYSRDSSSTDFTVCRRPLAAGHFDEIVKVGVGSSAFWIDRYEASVWQNENATGEVYFDGEGEFPVELPRNGQWRRTAGGRFPAFARSMTSLNPAVFITWFQAQAACRFSGKVLPSREQWLAAAAGTNDPGSDPGTSSRCRTDNLVGGSRPTGSGTSCVSAWGAQDMIGNVWEWTDEWDATLNTSITLSPVDVWPPSAGEMNGDVLANITSAVRPGNGDVNVAGMPAAATRGGSYEGGTRGGVFAMLLDRAPSGWRQTIGFRCVVLR